MDKNPQWYGFGTRSDKIICPNCGAQTALMDKNLVVNAWDSRPIEDALRSALAAADAAYEALAEYNIIRGRETTFLSKPSDSVNDAFNRWMNLHEDYIAAKSKAGV